MTHEEKTQVLQALKDELADLHFDTQISHDDFEQRREEIVSRMRSIDMFEDNPQAQMMKASIYELADKLRF